MSFVENCSSRRQEALTEVRGVKDEGRNETEPRYLGCYEVFKTPQFRAGLLVCWLIALATDALAHRLDECLQATRVAVATNRLDLSLDLTPGVAVADQVLAVIDTNHDGRLSKKERAAYAQQVLNDVRVGLDEKVLGLRVSSTTFPELREIRGGMGVIRIQATVTLGPLTAGDHALTFSNLHLPAISVYLVNALVPKDPAIQITRQTRDEFQKTYRLEFVVRAAPP